MFNTIPIVNAPASATWLFKRVGCRFSALEQQRSPPLAYVAHSLGKVWNASVGVAAFVVQQNGSRMPHPSPNMKAVWQRVTGGRHVVCQQGRLRGIRPETQPNEYVSTSARGKG